MVHQMQVQHNKALLRAAYERWHGTLGASVEHWMSLVHENISFGSLAEGTDPDAFTKKRQGKAALKGYFDGLTGNWTMIYGSVDDLVAEGDKVVAIGSASWRYNKTGRVVETPKVDVWQFRDGKAVSFYEYYDTAMMIWATADPVS